MPLRTVHAIKTDAPHGAHPPPKNEAPLLKPEAPFHEMIPRKSKINNNLTPSLNPSKMRVKKFIFSKFSGSQACIQQTLLSNKLLHMYF